VPVGSPRAAVLAVPAAAEGPLRRLTSDAEWLLELADAVARGPAGRATSAELLLVRERPAPLLAFVGDLREADLARLDALRTLLTELPARLRFLDWGAVEDAVDLLAELLADELGPELRGARVVGVPRGGLVVAGLLAVRLGLAADARVRPDAPGPTVVVDDCILSGSRLRGFLTAQGCPEVVVAALAAHPEARGALRQAVPGVRAVVGAVDLVDHAPALHGDAYPSWWERWRRRHPDDLWTGHPDLVAFPWNEPDSSFWNPVTGRSEPGWRVLPGSVCLKNRPPVDGDGAPTVVPHVEGAGFLRPPGRVLAGRAGEEMVVVGADSRCVRLSGTGADFWEAATTAPSEEAAVHLLRARHAASEETLRADLRTFVAALRERSLLVPARGAGR
jgi:hypothetical protein